MTERTAIRNTETVTCINCALVFTTTRIGNRDLRKYCSKKCSTAFRTWKLYQLRTTGIVYTRKLSSTHNCLICGSITDSMFHTKYCTECTSIGEKAKAKKISSKNTKMRRIALVALEMFPQLANIIEQKVFITATCFQCKNPFIQKQTNQRHCSKKCYTKSYQKLFPEKAREGSRRYREGITGPDRYCLYCKQLLTTRRKIFCERCGNSDTILKLHRSRSRTDVTNNKGRLERSKELKAIAEVALEMFPHLEELLDDSR